MTTPRKASTGELVKCLGCGLPFNDDARTNAPDAASFLAIHLEGAGNRNCRDAYCEADRLYRVPGTRRLLLVDTIHARLNGMRWSISGIDPTGGLVEIDRVKGDAKKAREVAAKYRQEGGQ